MRQALNLAVNKEAIIDARCSRAPAASPRTRCRPPCGPYNDKVEDYPYDPERAKQLLGAAKVTNLSTNIWAMPVQRYNPNARRMAELIQADWAEVGVQAEIVSFEWGEYLKRSQAGEHQTLLLGWTADIADPDNFLGVLLSCAAAKDGTNRARWCHQPFDQLITQAVRINDEASGPSCTSRRR